MKRNVMVQTLAEGGFKMIDLTSLNKALKTVWIKKKIIWMVITTEHESFSLMLSLDILEVPLYLKKILN